MSKNIIEIENQMSELLEDEELDILNEQLELVMALSKWQCNNFNENNHEVKNYHFTPMSFSKKITLLKEFLDYAHLNYDVDDMIKRGYLVVDFIEEQYDYFDITDRVRNEFGDSGFQKYYNELGENMIFVKDTNSILDLSVWAHEISHCIDQKKQKRTTVSCTFTETLAYYTEFLVASFLRQKGYQEDADMIINNIYNIFANTCHKNIFYYEALSYFKSNGYLNISDMEDFYSHNFDFDSVAKAMENKDKRDIKKAYRNNTRYKLAAFFAPYLYSLVKANPKYMELNQKLHDSISDQNLGYFLCLTSLSDVTGEELYDKLITSFKETFSSELLESELKK